jgi:hypothetical protein
MTTKDKIRLIDLLTETHSATRAVLEGIDLEMRVYKDGDWRIRDVLGHVATWDRETAKSLRAFKEGSEYIIHDLIEDDFNQKSVLEQRKLTTEDIFTEWEQAHEDLKSAVKEIPLEKFPGDFRYPWGDERGSITQLVDYFIEHDAEHRDEIEKAVQAIM